MIDVSRVINSPMLQKDYTVYRQTGHWVAGSWIESEEALSFSGPVTVATSRDLEQLPEGDRKKGAMCFYSTREIYSTRNNDNDKGTSDQIVWCGERYRVKEVFPRVDYGYWKALAGRMAGD
jgi:hypothetical protein